MSAPDPHLTRTSALGGRDVGPTSEHFTADPREVDGAMTTLATLPSSTTVQTEPTIEQIDAGLDDDLVAAAFEDLDDDPVVASLQADRDRLAARGDMDGARAHHRQVEEMRETQAAADRAAALADLEQLQQRCAEHDVEVQA